MLFYSLTENLLFWIVLAVPSILVASTVHEYAHAYLAFRLGDVTAKANGRLTLNPIKHIDPIGALSMILFRFGWSKPVPINEYNFEKRELYTAITAIAGPLSNIALAILTALVNLVINPAPGSPVELILYTFATINISLAIFNLLPFPPLDGHKIVRAMLPKGLRYYWESLEKYSLIIIVLLLLPISPLSRVTIGFIVSVLERTLTVLGF